MRSYFRYTEDGHISKVFFERWWRLQHLVRSSSCVCESEHCCDTVILLVELVG